MDLIPYTAGRAIVQGAVFRNPATGASVVTDVQCDDGSDVTAVSSTVAAALGATPIGQGQITGVDGSTFATPIYRLSLLTAYGDVLSWRVWQMPLGDVGGLIGNDILTRGLFEETPAGFYLRIGTAAPPQSTAVADGLLLGGVAAALLALVLHAATGGVRRVRRARAVA